MGFEIKAPKTPRPAKFVVLAFVIVIGIILFMDGSLSHNGWRNERVGVELLAVNSDNDNYDCFHQNSIDILTRKEQSLSNKVLYNKTSEDTATLQLLARNPRACFKKYDIHTTSDASSFFQVEALVVKKKIPFFLMLYTFNELMASLKIKSALIEPYILHCMLEARYKDLLKKRNFNIANFTKSNSIITYGIIADDAARLQEEAIVHKFRSVGLQPYFVQASPAEWMLKSSTGSKVEKYISHIFYNYCEWTIHVVVFQKRNSYLWHAEFNSNDNLNIPNKNDLLFADYDSAYEKFSFVHLHHKWPNFANLYVPSDPHYFLFQMPSSRFLECNLTRAKNVKPSTDSSSVNKFKSKTLVSLHELKTFFNPLLMHFWIFSGTMLGWYRQCGIIPYTSDVDFGAWASEIDNLDYIISHFLRNKKLTIVERMGMLEEALEFQLRADSLRVDVFFMYKINNGSWASGHRPSKGYYFRYYYPHFTLCSAELLEEKVQVPCETEDVIVTEYGANWMEPVSSWYYESSIHNRGPNIYWGDKRQPKAFQGF